MEDAGHPHNQAVAAALNNAHYKRKGRRKKRRGAMDQMAGRYHT
jgi:hypothetical protein